MLVSRHCHGLVIVHKVSLPPHHPERIEWIRNVVLNVDGLDQGPFRVGPLQIGIDRVEVALQLGRVIVQISREANLGLVEPLQFISGAEIATSVFSEWETRPPPCRKKSEEEGGII